MTAQPLPLPALAPLTAPPPTPPLRIALIQWSEHDGMAHSIYDALVTLGHPTTLVTAGCPLPPDTQVVFSQGPYGRFMEIPQQLRALPPGQRPLHVHWNDEGLPDLKIPWGLMYTLSRLRAWVGRLRYAEAPAQRALAKTPLVRWIDRRMNRFSYVGDYHWAYRQGYLSLLVDSSQIYADLHTAHGLPTLTVPWGSVPTWYADLGLERDIDVLWMGARASRRRSQLIDQVRAGLRAKGVEMYVVDNVERPFIFGDERTRILNRAKVTLNLTRTWYDDNFLRISIVMPNRSLVVSEPLLPHWPDYQAGQHYVSAPTDELAETIYYYLQHPAERQRIVEQAYQFITTRLPMTYAVGHILAVLHPRIRR
jgi:hypothetical protein